MQIFGGQFNEASGYGPSGEELPRWNFDYFVPAMLTCFVISTGAWYAPMLEGIKAVGPSAVPFYVVSVIIGSCA